MEPVPVDSGAAVKQAKLPSVAGLQRQSRADCQESATSLK